MMLRIKKAFLLALVLVACLSLSLTGWSEDINEVIDQINSQPVQENPDAEYIVKLLLDAEADGLPMGGLLNKVREGLAKKADSWMIYDVLVQKKEYLTEAKAIIDAAEENDVMVFDAERDIEDLAKILASGELSETMIREALSISESEGKEWSEIISACSLLGVEVILENEVKKEIIAISLEHDLDENSVEKITDEIEDAELEGQDVNEVLARVRSRYR